MNKDKNVDVAIKAEEKNVKAEADRLRKQVRTGVQAGFVPGWRIP